MFRIQLLVLFIIASSCNDKENKKHIYFTFVDGSTTAIGRTTVEPPDGKAVTANRVSGNPEDIQLDLITNKLYVSLGHSAVIDEYADGNIGNHKRIYKLQHVVTAMAVDPTRNRIYWAEGSFYKIYMGSMDGNKVPVLLFDGEGVTSQCTGMALNTETNTLYFTDFNENKIFEADLNKGTMPTEFSKNLLFDMDGPLDITLSKDGNSVYWTDLKNRIVSTDIKTKASIVLYNGQAKAIFVDQPTNDLYFSTDNQVFKFNLNASPVLNKVLDRSGVTGFVVF